MLSWFGPKYFLFESKLSNFNFSFFSFLHFASHGLDLASSFLIVLPCNISDKFISNLTPKPWNAQATRERANLGLIERNLFKYFQLDFSFSLQLSSQVWKSNWNWDCYEGSLHPLWSFHTEPQRKLLYIPFFQRARIHPIWFKPYKGGVKIGLVFYY